MTWLLRLPLIVILIGIGSCVMAIPAFHAYAVRDLETARAFLYSAILGLVFFGILGIATSSYSIRRQARSHLISILAFFCGLPLLLAVPFAEVVDDTSFLNAYVEMVSSLTTTGLTLFEADRLPLSLHLWRSTVGWLGGFFMWVIAVAVLAPLSLGGFEVVSKSEVGQGASGSTVQLDRAIDPSARLLRFAIKLFPIYLVLTGALWGALIFSGQSSAVAISHAMATISTSGISPLEGGPGAGQSTFVGEVVIFVFFIFALSRITFTIADRREGFRALWNDPELRLGLVLVILLPLLLFARHGFATFEDDANVALSEGIVGLWGAIFTVASFLTTTGFVSEAWGAAQSWSGLSNPGILLMGLAVFGGGVATTAGGVKLLRVYALYKHGVREMERLVQPSSVGGSGQYARRFRRQGAYVAWIFFMLFAMTIAVISVVLAYLGLNFEEALVVATATLSTTGPLVDIAMSEPMAVSQWSPGIKVVASIAMVLGRLETLVIVALLNPEFWR